MPMSLISTIVVVTYSIANSVFQLSPVQFVNKALGNKAQSGRIACK